MQLRVLLFIFFLFGGSTTANSQLLLHPNAGGLKVEMDVSGPSWWEGWFGYEYKLRNLDNTEIDIVQISGIRVPQDYVYVDQKASPTGWWFIGEFEDDHGHTTVSWLAAHGWEAKPGSVTSFWVWGKNAWTTTQGSFCALGPQSNCGRLPVMSWW
jgi:hypothetical protein